MRGCGITHCDSGTRESALQTSQRCREAIIVKVLLKYGANYICKQNSCPFFFFSLLEFYKIALKFLEVAPDSNNRDRHMGPF